MIIAFVAQSSSWDCILESRFGRTPAIVLFDSSTGNLQIKDNTANAEMGHGAGIQTAQSLVDAGISALITVSLGPKAFDVLREATIPVYYAPAGLSIHSAWELFQTKKLERADSPKH